MNTYVQIIHRILFCCSTFAAPGLTGRQAGGQAGRVGWWAANLHTLNNRHPKLTYPQPFYREYLKYSCVAITLPQLFCKPELPFALPNLPLTPSMPKKDSRVVFLKIRRAGCIQMEFCLIVWSFFLTRVTDDE
jgi:hypothetical protein